MFRVRAQVNLCGVGAGDGSAGGAAAGASVGDRLTTVGAQWAHAAGERATNVFTLVSRALRSGFDDYSYRKAVTRCAACRLDGLHRHSSRPRGRRAPRSHPHLPSSRTPRPLRPQKRPTPPAAPRRPTAQTSLPSRALTVALHTGDGREGDGATVVAGQTVRRRDRTGDEATASGENRADAFADAEFDELS